MSKTLRKLALLVILALASLPAGAKDAIAACGAMGWVYVACYPTDADSCRYGCYTLCNSHCPPTGACPTMMYCDQGGNACYCECVEPCPCPGGC